MSRITRFFANSFKLATSDLANQYAVPVKSMTGHVVSKYGASKSRRLNEKIVDKMEIRPDDKIFEVGFGRGDAIHMCYEKVANGKGTVFGVERSGYMDDVTRRRFDLEIAETGKIRIDSAIDLRNLPYPSNFFDHIFHVDVYYFLPDEHLIDINHELLRVLKPGSRLLCGIQFSRMRTLTNNQILHESQWNPMRYLSSLENAQFSDVKIDYHKDEELGEYQIISGRKDCGSLDNGDPEEMMRKLADDMKKERLAALMMNNKKVVE